MESSHAFSREGVLCLCFHWNKAWRSGVSVHGCITKSSLRWRDSKQCVRAVSSGVTGSQSARTMWRAGRVVRAVTSLEIRPVAAREQSTTSRSEDSLAAPQGKWNRVIPQSRTSPLMLQTPGSPSVAAPSSQRERRPDVRRCHPTRMLIGRSARRSGRGSDLDHHHLPNLLSNLPCQLRRRQMAKQNRTMCEEVVTCQRQMTRSQRNQKRSSKLGCPCLQSVARDPTLPSEGEKGIPRLVVTRWRNSSSCVLHVAHVRKRPWSPPSPAWLCSGDDWRFALCLTDFLMAGDSAFYWSKAALLKCEGA